MKGASEYVFKSCSHFMDENGQKIPITDVNQQQFQKIIDFYASQSLRTISLAFKDLRANEGGPKHENIKDGEVLYDIEKDGFTLIAIVGIKDVIRQEVPEAVSLCQKAGIIVRMVTGDNLITAKAIAKECGILNSELI